MHWVIKQLKYRDVAWKWGESFPILGDDHTSPVVSDPAFQSYLRIHLRDFTFIYEYTDPLHPLDAMEINLRKERDPAHWPRCKPVKCNKYSTVKMIVRIHSPQGDPTQLYLDPPSPPLSR
jgi:hypothetical protein